MNWADKLIGKIFPKSAPRDDFDAGYNGGKVDAGKYLVLGVLEEYRLIIEKSKQIKNPTSRKKFLRQRMARMTRELVQVCKEVKK